MNEMKQISREIRLWLHSEFLRWAMNIMPPGDERAAFALAVLPYCKYMAESARREILAREESKPVTQAYERLI